MHTTTQFLSDNFFLVILAGLPFFLMFQIYFLVRKMSEPEKMMVSLSHQLTPYQEAALVPYRGFLEANEMHQIAHFRFGNIETVTFQQANYPRFVSILFHRQGVTMDIETYFDEDNCSCLDTSTSGSAGMFPTRPNQYQQSFPRLAPDEAWGRHLEGETYLLERFGIKWKPFTMSYEHILVKALRLRMNFVRAIPLYPARALYWYFITRRAVANKSVQQRFPG